MKSIAIIGSGISALAAAHHLKPHAAVTLFERSPFRGGHSYTASLEVEGRSLDVDLGVQIVRPDVTPTAFALLESDPRFAGLELAEVEVGLTALIEDGPSRLHYCNLPHFQQQAPFSDDWARFGPECARFETLTSEPDDALRMTQIRAFCEQHGFDEDFIRAVLVPSMSVVNVTRNGLLDGLFVTSLEMPSALIGLRQPRTWQRFRGGVERFREIWTRGLEDNFELQREVVALHGQAGGGVTLAIRTPEGGIAKRDFDAAIWTGDLPAARRALDHADNPTRAQHMALLAPFAVEPALLYVHRDHSWLPKDLPLETLTVFHERGGERRMHYNPNLGQELGLPEPLWVTLLHERPTREPERMVHEPIVWTHPRNSFASFAAQRELYRLQGLDDIWFCGAGTVIDGFDSCLVSGIAVAERIMEEVGFAFAEPKTDQQVLAKGNYDAMTGVWMFPHDPFVLAKLGRHFDLLDEDHDGWLEWSDFERSGARLDASCGVERDSAEIDRGLYEALLQEPGVAPERRIPREVYVAFFARAQMFGDQAGPHGAPSWFMASVDALFDALDGDDDGRISVEDYAHFLRAHGVLDGAERPFELLDQDGDGYLSRDEVRELVAQYFFGSDLGHRGRHVYGVYDEDGG